MAAVLDRYRTGPRSRGAACRIPGVKTEKTAKKRRKKRQKWARYSHLKRVRAALLCLRNRYDMDKDQAQLNNVAAEHPDVVAEIQSLMVSQYDKSYDPNGVFHPPPPPPRPPPPSPDPQPSPCDHEGRCAEACIRAVF